MQTLIQLGYLAFAYLNRQQSNSPIDYHWVGNLTETSATIKLIPSRYHDAPLQIDIRHSNKVYDVPYYNGAYTLHLNQLTPAQNQKVQYLGEKEILFRTPDPARFRFAAISCQHTMSQSEVFSHVASHKPDLLLMLGDFHYSGHYFMDEEQFQFAVHEVFKSKEMRELYTQTPIVYMLDDHDCGVNNANSTHYSTSLAVKAHSKIVPGALQGAFTIGNTRFLQIDSRTKLLSEEGTSVFGADQLSWILQELSDSAEKDYDVVLMMSISWKSEREFNPETVHEKQLIAARIMELGFNQVGRPWLVMISGDSHQVSYDDGSANIYGNFPIFQCSPLDSSQNCKNPGWKTKVEVGRGQYCNFEISKQETGDNCLKFEAFRMDQSLVSHKVCRDSPSPQLTASTSDAWEWYKQPKADWGEILQNANREITSQSFSCPMLKVKKGAQIPIIFWMLVTGILSAYTLGRHITILGKRICE